MNKERRIRSLIIAMMLITMVEGLWSAAWYGKLQDAAKEAAKKVQAIRAQKDMAISEFGAQHGRLKMAKETTSDELALFDSKKETLLTSFDGMQAAKLKELEIKRDLRLYALDTTDTTDTTAKKKDVDAIENNHNREVEDVKKMYGDFKAQIVSDHAMINLAKNQEAIKRLENEIKIAPLQASRNIFDKKEAAEKKNKIDKLKEELSKMQANARALSHGLEEAYSKMTPERQTLFLGALEKEMDTFFNKNTRAMADGTLQDDEFFEVKRHFLETHRNDLYLKLSKKWQLLIELEKIKIANEKKSLNQQLTYVEQLRKEIVDLNNRKQMVPEGTRFGKTYEQRVANLQAQIEVKQKELEGALSQQEKVAGEE